MNKLIIKFILILLLGACSYEPILIKKNYEFNFENIIHEGEKDINQIIKNSLIEKTSINNSKKFILYLISEKKKEVIASNKKGDPTIYKINLNLEYKLELKDRVILKNKILKQATYNNIDDKFELLKNEENIIKNLSERFADNILISVATLTE